MDKVVFTEEDQALLEILRRKKRAAYDTSFMPRGNIATYAYSAKGTSSTHTLASTPKCIIDFGASRNATDNASKFSSYIHLAIPKSIQTVDGTTQPIVGIGIVKCTNSVHCVMCCMFPVNLLSISAIILQQKCVVSFDIPR